MARQSQMADIDQYLADGKQQEEQTRLPPVNVNAPTDAVGAPEIEQETGGQPSEELAPLPEDEEDERASVREMRKAQTEAARQREEESEVARATRQVAESITDSGVTVGDAIKRSARGVSSAVGSVPIPGDLLLPLSILLLFFFVLIPVNGHTRAAWLWLTMTGNASLTTGGGASFAPVSTTGTPLPITPLSGLPRLPTGLPILPTSGLTPLVPLASTPNPIIAFGTFAEQIL